MLNGKDDGIMALSKKEAYEQEKAAKQQKAQKAQQEQQQAQMLEIVKAMAPTPGVMINGFFINDAGPGSSLIRMAMSDMVAMSPGVPAAIRFVAVMERTVLNALTDTLIDLRKRLEARDNMPQPTVTTDIQRYDSDEKLAPLEEVGG